MTLHGPEPLWELLWQVHWSPLFISLTATWIFVSLCSQRNETIRLGGPNGAESPSLSNGKDCLWINRVAMTSCSQMVKAPSWSATARYCPPSLKRIWSIGSLSPDIGCATGSTKTDLLERTSREGSVVNNRGADPYTSSGGLRAESVSAIGGANAIVPWLDQPNNLDVCKYFD